MRAPQPTGFLGLPHLGVVGSIGYASLGQPVVAVDPDAAPVAMLSRGDVPVHEPSLDELFAIARERMVFSTDGGLHWTADPKLDTLMTGNGAFRACASNADPRPLSASSGG